MEAPNDEQTTSDAGGSSSNSNSNSPAPQETKPTSKLRDLRPEKDPIGAGKGAPKASGAVGY